MVHTQFSWRKCFPLIKFQSWNWGPTVVTFSIALGKSNLKQKQTIHALRAYLLAPATIELRKLLIEFLGKKINKKGEVQLFRILTGSLGCKGRFSWFAAATSKSKSKVIILKITSFILTELFTRYYCWKNHLKNMQRNTCQLENI